MEQQPPLKEAITALIETLRLEKNLLLEGAYDRMSEVGEKKAYYSEILAHHFSNKQPSELAAYQREITRIKTVAQENEKLLAAAKSGAVSARKRLETIMDREKTVGTYMESGYKLQTHEAGVTRHKIA